MELPKYIWQLDILRAFAVLVVMLYHLGGTFHFNWFAWGWAGVDLFFVVSGFLITGILLRSRESERYFRNFYARRVLRIWPLYFAFLALIMVVLPAAFPSAVGSTARTLHPAWLFPLFLQNFIAAEIAGPALVTWSLCIEEQFYIGWPLIVRFSKTATLKRILLAVIVCEPVLRFCLAGSRWSTAQYKFTFTRLDGLAVGCLLAIMAMEMSPAQLKRYAFGSLVIGTLILAVAGAFHFRAVYGTGISLVCAAIITLSSVTSVLPRWRMIEYVGKVSYGVYLFHLLVFAALGRTPVYRILQFNPLACSVVSILVTVSVASMSYHWFESPMLRLKKYFEDSEPHPSSRVVTRLSSIPVP